VEKDTKMVKGHTVCRSLKGEGVMTMVWIENRKQCDRFLLMDAERIRKHKKIEDMWVVLSG
jgi:hypothetical protein